MSDDVETRTVDAHIRNLRKKIGTERITTVVGFGYRYDPPAIG
jgi:DNA-binding response OmpR family regulator